MRSKDVLGMKCVVCRGEDIKEKEVEDKIEKKRLEVEPIGKVLKVAGIT